MAMRPVESYLQGLVQSLEGCGGGHGERAGYGRVGDPFGAVVEVEEVVLAFAVSLTCRSGGALAGGGAV